MIRRIQQIKSFGVFADFQWPFGLPEFKRFNLIYGWNYSGKTTLSRSLRCFESKQPHVDFPAAQVQLTAANGAMHYLHSPESAPVFRVFNTDFIRENLAFESASATPILVLGAEDIAKQETLKLKKAEREKLVLSKEANARKQADKAAGIEKALTSYARDCIKTPLSELNYDKRRFEPRVKECKADPTPHLMADDAVQQCLCTSRAAVLFRRSAVLRTISTRKGKSFLSATVAPLRTAKPPEA